MIRPRALPVLRRAAIAALLAALPARATAQTNCDLGYPTASAEPRTSVVFNESEVLRAFAPQGVATATPGLTLKLWYNDEHAMVLGVRRVIVKTAQGTTTTDYPVAPLAKNPGAAAAPAVGTTFLDGAQAGTDTATCAGYPDRCDRPMFPALFLTDVTADPTSRAGDWQAGGVPIPPSAVFGSWKAAVRTVDATRSPAVVTVTPDADPAKNGWNLGSGDAAPAGLNDEGYGAEVRWNVDDLVAAGAMVMGHSYRLQFMVHDGDQNKVGGDAGENCVNVTLPQCTTAANCNDANGCTDDVCTVDGRCEHHARPGCVPCHTAADCDDHDACTADSCSADGSCAITAQCRPEICDDRVDNDGDGLVDCADPDCATFPGCQGPHEICGNCIDDDGNGLTDFEDPACCAEASQNFRMVVSNGRLQPRGSATRFRLQTMLARSGLYVNPLAQDVFLQVRPENGTDVLCARIPATKFMGKHGAFMFWDHHNGTPSARGLSDMKIQIMRDGSVRLRTHGKRTQMLCPNAGRLQVTVGFLGATGDGGNRCSTTLQSFRAGRNGLLLAP